jgi:phage shock protein A
MNNVHGDAPMFATLQTLLRGASARADEQVRDRHAIALIDQKIREAEAELRAAKAGLAALIQRERSERRALDQLLARTAELTDRARAALAGGREDLAAEAAGAIAAQEDEAAARRATLDGLEARVLRLRGAVEAGHRRLIDLRQGAAQARALRREQDLQARLRTTLGGPSAADEACALIARVLDRDDPGEQADILRDIERDLDGGAAGDRLAEAGFGRPARTRAADVLARLKADG